MTDEKNQIKAVADASERAAGLIQRVTGQSYVKSNPSDSENRLCEIITLQETAETAIQHFLTSGNWPDVLSSAELIGTAVKGLAQVEEEPRLTVQFLTKAKQESPFDSVNALVGAVEVVRAEEREARSKRDELRKALADTYKVKPDPSKDSITDADLVTLVQV